MSNAASQANEDRGQLKSLKGELARLSTLIVSAKQRVDRYQLDETKVVEMAVTLRELGEKKNALETEVRAVKTRLIATKREIGRIEKRMEPLKKKALELESVNETGTEKYRLLKAQIHELTLARASSLAAAKEEKRLALQDINAKLGAAGDQYWKVMKEIRTGQKKLETMDIKKKELADLEAEIAAKKNTIIRLDEQIAAKAKIYTAKVRQIDDVDASIATKRQDHDAKCAQDWTDIKLARKDIEEREGRTNFLLRNLETKAGLLTQAKSELENFHGKQLRHIVIPEIKID